jgi:hypothetical protein
MVIHASGTTLIENAILKGLLQKRAQTGTDTYT